ncbi:MAG: O-antigen ligase family protein [Gaiellaceae bacterium]
MIGLAEIAGPIACLGLAVLLMARKRRNRIGGLAYTAVGAALLAASLKPGSAAEIAVAVVGLLVLGAGLAWLFRREPWLVAYLTLACIPVQVHFLHHMLLAPLYVVAAGAAFNLLRELVQGDERARELGIATRPLALYLAWIGLSLGWTVDVRNGALDVLVVYIPFAILALSIARLPWDELRLRLLYGELVAMALFLAGVGFYQYETGHIFENHKLDVSNTYAALFRVNSVFYDPSVYARFLVVALVPTAVLIVRGRSLRHGIAAFVFGIVAWIGLLISFSQSSFAALIVAVFCLCAVVWRWRSLAVVAVAVVLLAGAAVAEPKLLHALRHHGVSEVNALTSGRGSLIYNGILIARAHPVNGVGIGGFSRAYSKRTHHTPRKSASHNTPVTVAAEGGAIGFLLYAWLVVSLVRVAFRRIGDRDVGLLALSAGLVLVAIFTHSLGYNDFFEDPTTWGVFGLIGLAAARGRPSAMIDA